MYAESETCSDSQPDCMMRAFTNYQCLSPAPRELDSTGLGWGPAISRF